jgi:hypothetical protein
MSSPRTCKCIANSTGVRCKNRIREEEKYCRFHQDCDERKSVAKKSVAKKSIPKTVSNKSPLKKGSVKKQEEEELSRAFRELKVESKIRISPTKNRTPTVLFPGILNMIASYISNYYKIKVKFLNGTMKEFVLAIPEEVLNDYFIKISNYSRKKLVEEIVHIEYPELFYLSINNVEYEKIDYKDIEDKESMIFLDIYHMSDIFQFEQYYDPSKKIEEKDNEILKELIEMLKTETKNYDKYNTLVNELNSRLIHLLLDDIQIEDSKLVEPLFVGETPIIYKQGTLDALDWSVYDPRKTHKIRYNVKKFIVKVLIESIKVNNIPLCNIIINNIIGNRGNIEPVNELLINYCIEVAKEYNRPRIIRILKNIGKRDLEDYGNYDE